MRRISPRKVKLNLKFQCYVLKQMCRPVCPWQALRDRLPSVLMDRNALSIWHTSVLHPFVPIEKRAQGDTVTHTHTLILPGIHSLVVSQMLSQSVIVNLQVSLTLCPENQVGCLRSSDAAFPTGHYYTFKRGASLWGLSEFSMNVSDNLVWHIQQLKYFEQWPST